MCGIVGFVNSNERFDDRLVYEMASAIAHRGPDDSGSWSEKERGVHLAHRRLSIIDLSPSGRQPMESNCGRYVIVYNGEIYNHLSLRKQLEEMRGRQWRGSSDTETLLEAISCWGFEKTLSCVNGMFAIAVWDKAKRNLFLARDRMGEKPLYYGFQKGSFLFGSELKALRRHPDWEGNVDRDALTAYLRYSYVPAPMSVYSGIHKLLPGHYVVVDPNGSRLLQQRTYWNVVGSDWMDEPNTESIDIEERLESLEFLLRDSVKIRMASDVPLGAFLSGGIDSSLVVAMMQSQSSNPVRTFTIGFHEEEFNEATHAKRVAAHLGTEHTELYMGIDDATRVIPSLCETWDEPFADSSQIPTFLVSRLAREHVTVSLSGDGGDELFFGYDRYLKAMQIEALRRRVPPGVRRIGSKLLSSCPIGPFALAGAAIGNAKLGSLGDRMRKAGIILGARSEREVYQNLMSHSKDPSSLVLGGKEAPSIFTNSDYWLDHMKYGEQISYIDTLSYLPDDILTKVDRASMAVSLEARVPLLDHRIVEFAHRLPMSAKYRYKRTKWILREILGRYVPNSLMDRPKKGFGVPIELWLKGPLRDWAEELLREERLRREGFFNPGQVRKIWIEYLSNRGRWHYHLWDILMFQSWREKWH